MSNSMCYIHPNVFATFICDKCHQPICTNDHRLYGNCPTCFEKTKRESRIGDILLFLITIIAVGGLIVFIALYHPNFIISF